ncbi:MAG: hypothetical protein GF390_02090 [Candidatus Pacebacteria bacterium]|nr:hypothetical protein [Candidatus Paceibacterota bacterium]
MSKIWHSLILSLAVISAYFWLAIPTLKNYSLQAFMVVVLIYLLLKRVQKAKLWHLVPNFASAEMALATFAFLLIIGATGNTDSIFFFLTYLHLFFLVLTAKSFTAIVISMEIILFHYALSTNVSSVTISHLLSIPVMLLIFLFAKEQHEEVLKDRLIIEEEEKEIKELEAKLKSFNAHSSRPS